MTVLYLKLEDFTL